MSMPREYLRQLGARRDVKRQIRKLHKDIVVAKESPSRMSFEAFLLNARALRLSIAYITGRSRKKLDLRMMALVVEFGGNVLDIKDQALSSYGIQVCVELFDD